jgi:GT2 family glycosyltransferase
VIIPERDNIVELADCLAALYAAAGEWPEPFETIVVVNRSPRDQYATLRQAYSAARWVFEQRPLEFAKAVRTGLRVAQYDWVYLLNSDAVPDRGALHALRAHRDSDVFSIASQILLKDKTRYREETNWGALLLESGVAEIHDWIPRSAAPVETFYAGAGASLFQARLLRRFLNESVYSPFYWEDVEWGWRARKLGYRSVFCPGSIVNHRQRSTIGKYYTAADVENITRRHRFLFHLRNLTTCGSLSRVIEEIAGSPEEIAAYFLHPRTYSRIAAGRVWNHLAPVEDDEVFAAWNDSISRC